MKKSFLSLATICLVALTLMSCGGGSPKAAAEKFLNGLYHMDFEAAKSVSTEETKKQVDNYATLMNMGGEKAKEESKKIKVDVKDPKVEGDNATVEYTISGAGTDDNTPHTLRLVKQKGKWLAEWSKNDLYGGNPGDMGTTPEDMNPAPLSPNDMAMMAPPADGTVVDTAMQVNP